MRSPWKQMDLMRDVLMQLAIMGLEFGKETRKVGLNLSCDELVNQISRKRKKEKIDMQHLLISLLQILSLWPISSYQTGLLNSCTFTNWLSPAGVCWLWYTTRYESLNEAENERDTNLFSPCTRSFCLQYILNLDFFDMNSHF